MWKRLVSLARRTSPTALPMQPRYMGDEGDSLGGVMLAAETFWDISDFWGQHLRRQLCIRPIVSRTGAWESPGAFMISFQFYH